MFNVLAAPSGDRLRAFTPPSRIICGRNPVRTTASSMTTSHVPKRQQCGQHSDLPGTASPSMPAMAESRRPVQVCKRLLEELPGDTDLATTATLTATWPLITAAPEMPSPARRFLVCSQCPWRPASAAPLMRINPRPDSSNSASARVKAAMDRRTTARPARRQQPEHHQCRGLPLCPVAGFDQRQPSNSVNPLQRAITQINATTYRTASPGGSHPQQHALHGRPSADLPRG